MRIGVVGGGIVGTAVAATLQKVLNVSNFESPLDVTIIDDNRAHQTSKAGQGYLWSIHRANSSHLQLSEKAKRAWLDLIPTNFHDELFDPNARGSLLIADAGNEDPQKTDLYEYFTMAKKHLRNLSWVDSVSTSFDAAKRLPGSPLKPGLTSKGMIRENICGVYYPDDFTCVPTDVIAFLLKHYRLLNKFERRTVKNFGDESIGSSGNYDYLICCPGPWIQELVPSLKNRVIPIRGILLKAESTAFVQSKFANHRPIFPPMMEYGYGQANGMHFTLSFRNGGETALLGASREDVGFSVTGLDEVQSQLLQHADQFVIRESGIIGVVTQRTVGFRPAIRVDPSINHNHPYVVELLNSTMGAFNNKTKVILVYGFEGQGVLYSALAAKDVASIIMNDADKMK